MYFVWRYMYFVWYPMYFVWKNEKMKKYFWLEKKIKKWGREFLWVEGGENQNFFSRSEMTNFLIYNLGLRLMYFV